MDRLLHWIAPVLAVVAVLLLPALQGTLPFTPPAEWTIAQLGAELVHPGSTGTNTGAQHQDFRELLHQARQLQQELGGGAPSRQRRSVEIALALAALIPVAALLAGLGAILSLLFTIVRWRKLQVAAAILGIVTSAYAIAASLWLTRAAHAAARSGLASAETKLGRLLGGLHLPSLEPAIEKLGVWPEAGLSVVLLALIAVLVIPPPRKA